MSSKDQSIYSLVWILFAKFQSFKSELRSKSCDFEMDRCGLCSTDGERGLLLTKKSTNTERSLFTCLTVNFASIKCIQTCKWTFWPPASSFSGLLPRGRAVVSKWIEEKDTLSCKQSEGDFPRSFTSHSQQGGLRIAVPSPLCCVCRQQVFFYQGVWKCRFKKFQSEFNCEKKECGCPLGWGRMANGWNTMQNPILN